MKNQLVQARLASSLSSIEIGEGSALPGEIQWMPPGVHRIEPTIGGKPRELTIEVNEALAKRVGADLAAMIAAAAAGNGDVPYLDKNHEDSESVATVKALRWAGDDPKTGGIRIAVEWTGPGREAIEGRAFRRFSPQWLADETGQPAGLSVNMGGLVNRAAFRTIQPVVAKEGDPTQKAPMPEDKLQTSIQLIADAVKTLGDRISALETKIAAIPDQKAVTDRLAALEGGRSDTALTAARGRILALVASGKLVPQDKEGHEALAKALAVDPSIEATLARLPVNPAFSTITGRVGHAAGSTPETFPEAVAAAKASGAQSESEAVTSAIQDHPDLYRAWRAKGGSL